MELGWIRPGQNRHDHPSDVTFVSARGAVSITASVGVAEVAASDESVEERLLRLADDSMYRRKPNNVHGESRGRRTRRDAAGQAAEG